MKFEEYPFAICSAYASAIINGDYTGLEGAEDRDLFEFLLGVQDDLGVGHWTIAHSESEFDRDAVTGLMADCTLMFYCVPEA